MNRSTSPARARRRILLALAAFSPATAGCASARERPSPAQPPGTQESPVAVHAPQQPEGEPGEFERAHAQLTRGVRKTAAWVDAFLSDERSTEEENRSWVALGGEASIESREGLDARARIRSHVVLPRTERKLRLALLDEEDELGPADQPSEGAPVGAATTEEDLDLALQWLLKQTRRNNLRLEGGLRFDGFDPDPYTGVRWRHSWSTESWLLRAAERVRVQADSGLESRTTLDLERLLSGGLFWRATTRGTWVEEEPFEWGERLALYHRTATSRLLVLDLDAAVATEPAHVLDQLALRFRVSQRTLGGRLLLEIAPQLAWREEDDYAAVPGLLLRAELAFGRGEETSPPAAPAP